MITINDIQDNFFKISKNEVIDSEGKTFKTYKKLIDFPICSGEIQEIKLEDISIRRLNLRVKVRENIQVEIEEEGINVYFLFEGHSHLKLCNHIDCPLYSATHNLFYCPPCTYEFQVLPRHYDLLYMRLPLSTFKEYTHQNKGVFIPFYEGIHNKRPVNLRSEPGIIGHRIHRIVDEIFKNNSQEGLQPLFIKAKIIELLSVQMEQLCNLCRPPAKLSKASAERMFAVRDFMMTHTNEYHSLKSLAQRVGTNEFTLKKEFKKLFGNTVFRYWHEIKMEKAQNLLSENDLSIKEISEAIGYKNPQHFSTAFKKNYGISPSEFKKRN